MITKSDKHSHGLSCLANETSRSASILGSSLILYTTLYSAEVYVAFPSNYSAFIRGCFSSSSSSSSSELMNTFTTLRAQANGYICAPSGSASASQVFQLDRLRAIRNAKLMLSLTTLGILSMNAVGSYREGMQEFTEGVFQGSVPLKTNTVLRRHAVNKALVVRMANNNELVSIIRGAQKRRMERETQRQEKNGGSVEVLPILTGRRASVALRETVRDVYGPHLSQGIYTNVRNVGKLLAGVNGGGGLGGNNGVERVIIQVDQARDIEAAQQVASCFNSPAPSSHNREAIIVYQGSNDAGSESLAQVEGKNMLRIDDRMVVLCALLEWIYKTMQQQKAEKKKKREKKKEKKKKNKHDGNDSMGGSQVLATSSASEASSDQRVERMEGPEWLVDRIGNVTRTAAINLLSSLMTGYTYTRTGLVALQNTLAEGGVNMLQTCRSIYHASILPSLDRVSKLLLAPSTYEGLHSVVVGLCDRLHSNLLHTLTMAHLFGAHAYQCSVSVYDDVSIRLITTLREWYVPNVYLDIATTRGRRGHVGMNEDYVQSGISRAGLTYASLPTIKEGEGDRGESLIIIKRHLLSDSLSLAMQYSSRGYRVCILDGGGHLVEDSSQHAERRRLVECIHNGDYANIALICEREEKESMWSDVVRKVAVEGRDLAQVASDLQQWKEKIVEGC